MSRDLYINGECLVSVIGGLHLSGLLTTEDDSVSAELGLAVDSIKVLPKMYHRPMMTNDFGPMVAPNVMTHCSHVDINMTLVHYDAGVLDICWGESVGYHQTVNVPTTSTSEIRLLVGKPLGNGGPLYSSGNHFITIDLAAPQLSGTWRFPACYLVNEPFEYPVGVKASRVDMTWRSVPYAPFTSGEIRSSGVLVWQYIPDEPEDEE